MQWLSRLLDAAANTTSVLAGVAVAAMMVQVTLDVALRHVLGAPLTGTLTIVSHYYMVIAAFVPLALAEQRDAHISVEFLTELFPARVRRHLAGLMILPTAAVAGLLAWRTFEAALRAYRTGEAQVAGFAQIPVWPAYFALPLGAGIMTAILLLRFAAYATGTPLRERRR